MKKEIILKKKKILFVHWALVCGGAERALFDLIRLMDKEKFDITVFTLKTDGEWKNRFIEEGIRVIDPYSNLKPSKRILGKIRNVVRLKKIDSIQKNNGKGLVDYCCGEKFDLIIAYAIFDFCKEAAFQKNTKSIKYIHGNVESNIPYQKRILTNPQYLDKFDRIICVSEDAKKAFVRMYKDTHNIMGILNPIYYPEIFNKASKKINITFDEEYMVVVGRLEPEKGVERLVRIHKRLLLDQIKHKLVIIGDGSERKNIEQCIEDNQVSDSVIMVGYTDNPYPFIKSSKLLVCPSYSEGMSVVSAEAICLGIPVVAAVPSVREVFGDKECGVITENDDESLYKGISKMYLENDFFNMTKQNAIERSKYLCSRAMVEKVEQVYIDLIGE